MRWFHVSHGQYNRQATIWIVWQQSKKQPIVEWYVPIYNRLYLGYGEKMSISDFSHAPIRLSLSHSTSFSVSLLFLSLSRKIKIQRGTSSSRLMSPHCTCSYVAITCSSISPGENVVVNTYIYTSTFIFTSASLPNVKRRKFVPPPLDLSLSSIYMCLHFPKHKSHDRFY